MGQFYLDPEDRTVIEIIKDDFSDIDDIIEEKYGLQAARIDFADGEDPRQILEDEYPDAIDKNVVSRTINNECYFVYGDLDTADADFAEAVINEVISLDKAGIYSVELYDDDFDLQDSGFWLTREGAFDVIGDNAIALGEYNSVADLCQDLSIYNSNEYIYRGLMLQEILDGYQVMRANVDFNNANPARTLPLYEDSFVKIGTKNEGISIENKSDYNIELPEPFSRDIYPNEELELGDWDTKEMIEALSIAYLADNGLNYYVEGFDISNAPDVQNEVEYEYNRWTYGGQDELSDSDKNYIAERVSSSKSVQRQVGDYIGVLQENRSVNTAIDQIKEEYNKSLSSDIQPTKKIGQDINM